ncbi:sulfite exporter TauE/SafE family protein [Bosea sp. BK604]|uniref:urease accessory protein UreH domain-containing protein n=1 Tax=Bosea sp. BK604 TaxID=2512180 RepID=UPI001404349A|nr:sulfite exporter TauE/SafE family protein [Bosea sp. BK604]
MSGMTCLHCEIAVERALRAVPGVHEAKAEFSANRVSIEHDGPLDEQAVATALLSEGYALGTPGTPSRRRYAEAGAAVILVLAVLLAARQFDWPKGISVSENMSLGFVFVIGLLASVSSCMAVTGGLLVALAAKYNETTIGLSPGRRLIPHLWFNAGRLVSYTGFGAVIGAAGSAFALSPSLSGALTITISTLMMIIGLQMLGLFPRFSRALPIVPKSLLHSIHDLRLRTSRTAALILGAATFFLPCGFTLALQLYVLGKGEAGLGAATMLVFALGTLPALLGLSILSSFTGGALQARFLTIAGAFVLVLGLMNMQYGFVQLDQSLPNVGLISSAAAPQETPARQVIDMTVSGFDYIPNRFVVKAGLPVEWRIDAREAEGCGRILISRSLGLRKLLSDTETTVITFTPQQAGEYAFNCSMGMMTPNSGFRVIN